MGVGCVGAAVLLFYHTRMAQNVLRPFIEREISKNLQQRITIGAISGNLLTEATLHRVRFYNKPQFDKGVALEIGELTAHYSLIQTLKFKGDIAKASSIIELDHVKLNVIRSLEDDWNVFHLLPPPNPLTPPTFVGKMIIKNLTIGYIDYKGWADTPLSQPFRNQFTQFQGIIDYKNLSQTKVFLVGKANGTESPIKVSGLMNTYDGQFTLRLTLLNLDVKKWGAYVLPIQGVNFLGGQATLKGIVKTKPLGQEYDMPFWYDLRFALEDTDFTLPFFKSPVLSGKGRFHLTHKRADQNQLDVNEAQGWLHRIPLHTQGTFYLNQGKLFLNMTSEPFQLRELWGLFNVPFSYTSQATTRFQVQGQVAAPLVQGVLKTHNLLANYRYLDHVLGLGVEAQTPLGVITGNVTLDLNSSPVKIKGVLGSDHVAVLDYGSLGATVSFEGDSDHLIVLGQGRGNPLSIYGQSVTRLLGWGQMTHLSDLKIENMDVWLNQSSKNESLQVTGDMQLGKAFSLFFHGQLPFADLDPDKVHSQSGLMQVTGNLRGSMDAKTGAVPLNSLVGKLKAKIRNYVFFGHPYASVSVNVTFDQDRIYLERFFAENNTESVLANGSFFRLKPQKLSLDIQELSLAQKFVQLYIPLNFKPFDGTMTLKGSMQRQEKAASQNSKLINTAWKWLENYIVSGSMHVIKGLVQNQPIESLTLASNWNGNVVDLHHAELRQGSSKIALHGQVNLQKELNLTFEPGTHINFGDFNVLTGSLGQFSGEMVLDGELKGTSQHPVINMRIDAKPFKSNYLNFDQVKGAVIFDHGYLSFQPLILSQGNDLYKLKGHINITPFFQEKIVFSDVDYKMDFSVTDVDLDSFSGLIEAIQKEVRQHFITHAGPPPNELGDPKKQGRKAPSLLSIEDPSFQEEGALLYSDSLKNTAISLYSQLQTQYQEREFLPDLGIRQLFKGQLSLKLSAQSRGKQAPLVDASLIFNNLEVAFLKSKSLVCLIKNTEEAVNIDLDIKDGTLGNKHFDQAVIKTALDTKGNLNIVKTKLASGFSSSEDIIKGVIPLSSFWNPQMAFAPMQLDIQLKGNNLGLLSILNPNIVDITNEGAVTVRVTGPLRNPMINSTELNLKNTKIVLDKEATLMESPLQITAGNLVIRDNKLSIPGGTKIFWQGPDTKSLRASKEMLNELSVSGSVSLDTLDLLAFQRTALIFDLKLKDTCLYIHLPSVYNGEVSLQGMSLKGAYEIPLSKSAKAKWDTLIVKDRETGPVVSGRMVLNNAEIAMPTFAKKTPKPSLLLDIDTAVLSDVSIAGSLFGDDLLSGIANTFQLSLATTLTDVKVTGTLNTPRMINSLVFSEGTVSLFNREFTVLTPEKQKDYYQASELKTHKNTLSLTTAEDSIAGIIRIVPVLDLLAVTVVEKTATSSSSAGKDPDADKDKHVVVLIKGPVYNPSSFYFEKFVDDSSKMRFQASYTFQDLSAVLELLMPDFYDIAYSGQVNSDQTKRLISQVGETGVNSVIRSKVIRPMEKQVAHNIGVSDVQVDYNVGSALFGAANIQGVGNVQSNVGVSVIQNLLSDQLVLRVKTNLDLKGQTDTQISEWELTYYFLRHFSLNYSQIRETLGAPLKPKTALKYSYDY